MAGVSAGVVPQVTIREMVGRSPVFSPVLELSAVPLSSPPALEVPLELLPAVEELLSPLPPQAAKSVTIRVRASSIAVIFFAISKIYLLSIFRPGSIFLAAGTLNCALSRWDHAHEGVPPHVFAKFTQALNLTYMDIIVLSPGNVNSFLVEIQFFSLEIPFQSL